MWIPPFRPSCWSVTAITPKKPNAWKDYTKPNIWNSQHNMVAVMSSCEGKFILPYGRAFLWRFSLRVVPLSPSPSCLTRKQSSRKEFCAGIFSSRFIYGHAQRTKRKRDTRRLMGMLLCDAKAICGTTSLRVTVLASLMRRNKDNGNRKEQKNKTRRTNWTK